jgi:hypothetical protein
MFIREKTTKNRSTGISYTKHQLVRSVRDGSSVRQEIVMELGKLDIDRSQWKRLAHTLSMRLSGSDSLFESDDEIKEIADQAIINYFSVQGSKSERTEILESGEFTNVDLSSVSASEVKSLGPELLATSFYDRLGIGEILTGCGFDGKEQALAKAVICSRLITPGSDLATWRYLGSATALPELIDDSIANISKDPVYLIADALYENKDAIESALVKREAELYPGARLFLFDLTNAYFEGRTLNNDLAYYGHSKEKRYDCTLVSLALLVDDRGMPIYSRIYPGNQSEPETLSDVLESIKDLLKLGLFREDSPTVVMDRGIATKDNIELVQSYGLPYLVIERSDKAKKYLDEFKKDRNSFSEITNSSDETIYLKDASDNGDDNNAGDSNDIHRVLCISERRGKKEQAISDQQLRARWELAVKVEDVGPERFASGTTSIALVLLDLFSPVRHRFLCGAAEPVDQHGGGGFAREPWNVAFEHECQTSDFFLPSPDWTAKLKGGKHGRMSITVAPDSMSPSETQKSA